MRRERRRVRGGRDWDGWRRRFGAPREPRNTEIRGTEPFNEDRDCATHNTWVMRSMGLGEPRSCGKPIVLGINTDGWQPLEKRLKVTRGVLEVLAECRHPLTPHEKVGNPQSKSVSVVLEVTNGQRTAHAGDELRHQCKEIPLRLADHLKFIASVSPPNDPSIRASPHPSAAREAPSSINVGVPSPQVDSLSDATSHAEYRHMAKRTRKESSNRTKAPRAWVLSAKGEDRQYGGTSRIRRCALPRLPI